MTVHRHTAVAAPLAAFRVPCLAAASCVSTSGVELGAERFPARAQSHRVAVYDSEADLPAPYTKVARIVLDDASLVRWDAVVAAMCAEARTVGADALVLDGLTRRWAASGDQCRQGALHALAVRFGGD